MPVDARGDSEEESSPHNLPEGIATMKLGPGVFAGMAAAGGVALVLTRLRTVG
jgi:hypothetical protein